MAKLGPGVVVGGLTLGAVAVIGLLAFQANGAASRAVASTPASASAPSAAASPSASEKPTAPPLPADSGAGLRVVFSLKDRQVWLVDPKKPEQVVASFRVTPSNALPNPGAYTVYSRTAAGTGTDGRQIEHVVRFAQQQGTVFGFSALVDENAPAPSLDPKTKLGGIRASRADGQVLWDFAPNGTRVVVVA